MRDTPITLAQCSQCDRFVFACNSSGIKTTADPAPLTTPEEFRNALLAGKGLYRLTTVAGKPHKLIRVTTLAEGATLLADHNCGATHRHASAVEVVPVDPRQAPAMPGGLQAGTRQPHAPESGSQGRTAVPDLRTGTRRFLAGLPSPATPASPHPSRHVKPGRCATCRGLIRHTDPDVYGIEYQNRLVWAQHVECPRSTR